ncbi:hypothetical protein LguiA_019490 [Lonicera macranthoides]
MGCTSFSTPTGEPSSLVKSESDGGGSIQLFVICVNDKYARSVIMVYEDRNVVAQLVRRAERAGFKAIVLTVDTPRLGRREADIKNRRTPRGAPQGEAWEKCSEACIFDEFMRRKPLMFEAYVRRLRRLFIKTTKF